VKPDLAEQCERQESLLQPGLVASHAAILLSTVLGGIVFAALFATRNSFGSLFSEEDATVSLVSAVIPFVASFQALRRVHEWLSPPITLQINRFPDCRRVGWKLRRCTKGHGSPARRRLCQRGRLLRNVSVRLRLP
jgi:hypothetical protein